MSCNLKFFVKTIPGERIETVLTLPEEPRCCLYGTVQNTDGAPLGDVAVLLCDAESHRPVGQAFTSEEGTFFFGPLEPDCLYYINIYHSSNRIRTLEIKV